MFSRSLVSLVWRSEGSMGFLSLARELMGEHGKFGMAQLRKTGKIVAPGLTRRVSKGIHKNRRLVKALSGAVANTFDVLDAASVGDLAGGLHSGVHLGQSAIAVFNAAKRRSRGTRPFGRGLQTKPKRIGRDDSGGSSLEQFDTGTANDPKISGDLLARMTKSTRTSQSHLCGWW